jgi:hypothetical protein
VLIFLSLTNTQKTCSHPPSGSTHEPLLHPLILAIAIWKIPPTRSRTQHQKLLLPTQTDFIHSGYKTGYSDEKEGQPVPAGLLVSI